MLGRVDVLARRGARWAYDDIEIFVRRVEYEGTTERKRTFYASATFTEYDWQRVNVEERPPTLVLPEEAAQSLLDNLWDCGLRPSEAQYEKGALAEAKEHIASLKEVVCPLLTTVAAIATRPEHRCVRVEEGEGREVRGLLSSEEFRKIRVRGK